MPSTDLLVKIAAGGFVATTVVYSFFTQRIQSEFRRSSYVQQSIDLLHGYPPAEQILGKPIMLKKLDLGHQFHEVNDHIARVALPIHGPKGKAQVFSWCSKPADADKDSWRVDRLDLKLNSTGQNWTFYRHPDLPADFGNKLSTKSEKQSTGNGKQQHDMKIKLR